ncbi:MAG: hypothetical protein AAFR00_01370 [Pseudomonadota bacterium]
MFSFKILAVLTFVAGFYSQTALACSCAQASEEQARRDFNAAEKVFLGFPVTVHFDGLDQCDPATATPATHEPQARIQVVTAAKGTSDGAIEVAVLSNAAPIVISDDCKVSRDWNSCTYPVGVYVGGGIDSARWYYLTRGVNGLLYTQHSCSPLTKFGEAMARDLLMEIDVDD